MMTDVLATQSHTTITSDCSFQFLLAGLLFLVVACLLKLIVQVALLIGRLAFRSAGAAFTGPAGARFDPVDLSAAGDHVGVRRTHRRRRVAVSRGSVGNAELIFDALAQSCRRYYRD